MIEYRSERTLLGLPLLHVAAGAEDGKPLVARGWIAIGDVALGVLLSAGGIAVGGVALGGVGLGVISLAGLAVGALAVGGVAAGGYAFGGIALGWTAAAGGIAVAREFAVGGVAYAHHANDVEARRFFEHDLVPALGRTFAQIGPWLVLGLVVFARVIAARDEGSAKRRPGSRSGR